MRTKKQLFEAVQRALDEHRDEITAIGRRVWKHPEPGFREFDTAKLAEETLRSYGYAPRTGLSVTGLRADLDGSADGPTIAVLGEMDALIIPTHPDADPVTGAVHACGHNSHITAMLGAAIALKAAHAEADLSGTVAFIATPAEEGILLDAREKLMHEGRIHALSGKASLILEGVFDDVDLAFMNHLGGAFDAADYNGSCIKNVVFHGCASHAADPGDSRNALAAATLSLNALAMLREQFAVDSSVRMHGIISDGGNAVNVIPDRVVLEYQLRANTFPCLNRLSEAFDRAVRGCADALGCTVEIQSHHGFYPLHNDPELYRVYADAVRAVRPGETVKADIGFSHGCTDMGDLSAIMPALHSTCKGAAGGGHTVDYRIANEQEAYVENAAVLALMCVELLADDAATGRKIAARKQDCLPVEEYKKAIDAFRYRR